MVELNAEKTFLKWRRERKSEKEERPEYVLLKLRICIII